MKFKLIFKTEGLERNPFKKIITKILGNELVKYYNEYADETNKFIDVWNELFEKNNPEYFEINKGKDVWELVDYNNFMSNKFREVISNMHFNKRSKLLNFDIGNEVNLIGIFKYNPKVKIEFYLKEM